MCLQLYLYFCVILCVKVLLHVAANCPAPGHALGHYCRRSWEKLATRLNFAQKIGSLFSSKLGDQGFSKIYSIGSGNTGTDGFLVDGKTEFGVRAEVAVGDGGTGWWRPLVRMVETLVGAGRWEWEAAGENLQALAPMDQQLNTLGKPII